MKKLLIAIAAIAFTSSAAYAAVDMAMDCCKDCCKDKHDGHATPAPAPAPKK